MAQLGLIRLRRIGVVAITNYYVYILQSIKTGELYTGQTNNLDRRLDYHNLGTEQSTKHAVPWKIVYNECYPNRSDAMKREKFLKSGVGREFIRNKVGYPPDPRIETI